MNELLTKYYSCAQVKKNLPARDVGGGEETCLQGSVGTPQGKRSRGRHRSRWEYNIKMDLILYRPCIILQYVRNPTRYTIFND